MQIRDVLTEKRLRNLEPMVAEISVDELRAKIQLGEIFKLIEVSDPEDFDKGHLPDAVNIPIKDLLAEAARRFRQFQQIVLYCEEGTSSVGFTASRQLQQAGFSNVLVLKGGKEAWQSAGLSLQGKKTESSDDQG